MKQIKTLKILCTFFIIILFNSCTPSGKEPEGLLRMTGLKINDYEVIYKDDNLKRDSSAWDNFNYSIKVKDNGEGLMKQLDKLVDDNDNWTRVDGGYEYNDEEDGNYELSVYVYLDQSIIEVHYLKYNIFA